jgi:Uma2 family endonuclease
MGILTTGLLTFEEFERLPEDPNIPYKCELLEGELIQMPPADLEHARFSKFIFLLLLDALEKAHTRGEAAELGEVFHEAGYKLSGRSYVQPDVSITHAAHAHAKYLNGAPAIAVEVISESNTAREMGKKLALYFRYGAREVWHVYRDPLYFVVHFADSSRTIREGSITTPLLPGFKLPLASLEALIEKP